MRDCSCRQSHSSAHICARQNIISIWEITWKPFHWFHVFITFCIRYYLGVVAVRTKSTTCQNLPIFPPKLCQRIVSLHLSLMFLFFCSYLRFCCRRCFHACHCHLYNSFFIQHNFSEFFPFFFSFRSQNLTHLLLKAEDQSALCRVVLSGLRHLPDFWCRIYNCLSKSCIFFKFNWVHSNFNKPSLHRYQVD